VISIGGESQAADRDQTARGEIIVEFVFGLHQRGVGISETSKSGLRSFFRQKEACQVSRKAPALLIYAFQPPLPRLTPRSTRETTHNEQSAASTSFKKTVLSKHNAEYVWCIKVLTGETNMFDESEKPEISPSLQESVKDVQALRNAQFNIQR
jgi:hypothetical protein